MRKKRIRLLSVEDWRYVKIIEISKNSYQNGIDEAYIVYTRECSDIFDNPRDELDDLILDAIKTRYKDAYARTRLIYADGDRDTIASSLPPLKDTVEVSLGPIITPEDYNKRTYYRYLYTLDIYSANIERFKYEGFFKSHKIAEIDSIEKMHSECKAHSL